MPVVSAVRRSGVKSCRSHAGRIGRLTACALVLFGLTAGRVSAEDAAAESEMLARINLLRESNGVAPLIVDFELRDVANYWSARMASAQVVSENPDRAAQISNASKIAENVGRGSSAAEVYEAFVARPAQHANLVDPALEFVGIGVVARGSLIYVTVDFKRAADAAGVPPAPAPIRPPPTAPPGTAPPGTAPPPRKGDVPRGFFAPVVADRSRANLDGLSALPDTTASTQLASRPSLKLGDGVALPPERGARGGAAEHVHALLWFVAAAFVCVNAAGLVNWWRNQPRWALPAR